MCDNHVNVAIKKKTLRLASDPFLFDVYDECVCACVLWMLEGGRVASNVAQYLRMNPIRTLDVGVASGGRRTD